MPERARIGLDNPAFRGRLRRPVAPASPRRSVPPHRPVSADYAIREVTHTPLSAEVAPSTDASRGWLKPAAASRSLASVVMGTTVAAPMLAAAGPEQVGSLDLEPFTDRVSQLSGRLGRRAQRARTELSLFARHYSRLQLTLFGMACLVFLVGVVVSWQTWRTNHAAAAQVSVLSQRLAQQTAGGAIESGPPTLGSSGPPTTQELSAYTTAADLARFIRIPQLSVFARVLQSSRTTADVPTLPTSAYDTTWYTGSAKPGQSGVTVVTGETDNGTSAGVFVGLTKLTAGDQIQLVRGDGTILNYQVVKVQTYATGQLTMPTATTPATAGSNGLNLIGSDTTGDQQVVVFAQQVVGN